MMMSTMKKRVMSPTRLLIRKRLIWIKAVNALLKEIANSFTHKTSKRRDIVILMQKMLRSLEREVRRDIKRDV